MLKVRVIEVSCNKCGLKQQYMFHGTAIYGGVVASSNNSDVPLFLRSDGIMKHSRDCTCTEKDVPAKLKLLGDMRWCHRCKHIFKSNVECPTCGDLVRKGAAAKQGKKVLRTKGRGAINDVMWDPDDAEIDASESRRYYDQRNLWRKVPDTTMGWQSGRGRL